jgi:hypothetical protein
MNIHVHIERLILDGLPVTTAQGPLVQAAIETELTRLLAEGDLSALSGGAVPHLPVASILLDPDNTPSHTGHQIAGALYSSLAPAPASSRQTGFTEGAPE